MLPTIFSEDESALHLRIGRLVTDEMLVTVAASDDGRDEDAHERILRRMRDFDVVPEARWEPLEALSLSQWHKPGEDRDAHLVRVFCCAWLLRIAVSKDRDAVVQPHVTATLLVLSLSRLDQDLWDEAGRLLTWLIASGPDDGQNPDIAFLGLTVLRCALGSHHVTDDQIIALCEWIADREAQEPSAWAFDDRWMSRIHHDKGTALTSVMLAQDFQALELDGRSNGVRTWVGLISALLLDPR